MHVESRQCPAEFQERLTRAFGCNIYGQPNFKIAWTQSHFIRMGNLWRDKHGNERRGYRDRFTCGTPCWAIMRWKHASFYGSPALYYMNTWDNVSQLYAVGEYPYGGRYEVVQPMFRKEFVDNKLVIDSFPLSHILIDKIIPLLLQMQNMTVAEQQAAKQLVKEQEEKAQTNEIADRMMSDLPAWYGPVSFSRQGIRTSLLDRKMEKIQKAWDRLSRNGRPPQFTRGIQQGQAPRIVN